MNSLRLLANPNGRLKAFPSDVNVSKEDSITMRFTLAIASLALSTIAFAQNPITADSTFQIRYASNLNIGDSDVNISNSGATGASLCANIYTFDPAEELISCCTCSVTPNALQSLSVRNSLISNTLTAAIPTSVVIKIVSSPAGAACNASTVAALAPGLLAWG